VGKGSRKKQVVRGRVQQDSIKQRKKKKSLGLDKNVKRGKGTVPAQGEGMKGVTRKIRALKLDGLLDRVYLNKI